MCLTASTEQQTGASPAPLWRRTDTALLLRMLPAAVVACLLPERHWPTVAEATVRRGLIGRVDPNKTRKLITAFIGDRLPASTIEEAALASVVAQRLLQLQTMRLFLADTWHAPTRLHGLHHVEAAQAAGRGVVLWVVPTVFATLAGKRATHMAGLSVHHLSRFAHGFSDSRLGARLLNPIRCRPENRWLAERVVIERGKTPVAAMRRLGRVLKDSGIVSITIGHEADRPLYLPFLDGRLAVATGAPRLAARTGAALVPVVTVGDGAGFATTLCQPIGDAQELVPVLEKTALERPAELHWYAPLFCSPSAVGPQKRPTYSSPPSA